MLFQLLFLAFLLATVIALFVAVAWLMRGARQSGEADFVRRSCGALALVAVEACSGILTLTPAVFTPKGLLVEELWVYHALQVGSVEPSASASLCSVWALSTASAAAFKSGRESRAILRNSSRGISWSLKS